MSALAKWIIFYTDKSSFSDLDGPPHLAPRWGVACVALVDEKGRSVWGGRDYYVFHERTLWFNVDFTGLLDYLAEPVAEKVVLFGRHMRSADYAKMLVDALNDERLPVVPEDTFRSQGILVRPWGAGHTEYGAIG
jgi:hypothetical protein